MDSVKELALSVTVITAFCPSLPVAYKVAEALFSASAVIVIISSSEIICVFVL